MKRTIRNSVKFQQLAAAIQGSYNSISLIALADFIDEKLNEPTGEEVDIGSAYELMKASGQQQIAYSAVQFVAWLQRKGYRLMYDETAVKKAELQKQIDDAKALLANLVGQLEALK